MAADIGLKIALEGEKDFKKAIADINAQFKVLGSEMQLVTSEFGKNDNSVAALTRKNEVLNKEIEQQKTKIETLRNALNNSSEAFGENDRRTLAWQTQLNKAEAELNDMERELRDNVSSLETMDKGFDEAANAADKFGNDVDDAGNQSDDASGKFDKLGSVCTAAAASIAAAFAATAAAAVAAGKALVDMSIQGADYADTVLTESTVTGIATEKLQEYMYAIEPVKVSVETSTSSAAYIYS